MNRELLEMHFCAFAVMIRSFCHGQLTETSRQWSMTMMTYGSSNRSVSALTAMATILTTHTLWPATNGLKSKLHLHSTSSSNAIYMASTTDEEQRQSDCHYPNSFRTKQIRFGLCRTGHIRKVAV